MQKLVYKKNSIGAHLRRKVSMFTDMNCRLSVNLGFATRRAVSTCSCQRRFSSFFLSYDFHHLLVIYDVWQMLHQLTDAVLNDDMTVCVGDPYLGLSDSPDLGAKIADAVASTSSGRLPSNGGWSSCKTCNHKQCLFCCTIAAGIAMASRPELKAPFTAVATIMNARFRELLCVLGKYWWVAEQIFSHPSKSTCVATLQRREGPNRHCQTLLTSTIGSGSAGNI